MCRKIEILKEIHDLSSVLYTVTWRAMQPWYAEAARNASIKKEVMVCMDKLAALHGELKHIEGQ